MLLGSSTLGSTPLGGIGAFGATFDLSPRPNERSIIEVASFIDQQLIRDVYHAPDRLRTIDRRHFEQLVAELFDGFGYQVEFTKRTRDGGKDIIAVRRREVDVKFLIECKRPDPDNPVAVSTVRELYGVKVSEGATKAILATTTYLTSDARQLIEKHRWELEAREFEAIGEWVKEYLAIKGIISGL